MLLIHSLSCCCPNQKSLSSPSIFEGDSSSLWLKSQGMANKFSMCFPKVFPLIGCKCNRDSLIPISISHLHLDSFGLGASPWCDIFKMPLDLFRDKKFAHPPAPRSGRGPLKSSGGEPGKPTLPDDQAGSSSGQRPLKPANGKGGRSVVPSFTDEMLAASKPLASINFKAASGPSTRPGVLPSPCFPNFLARTTFVLESLPEVKNPGEDAIFGDFLFNSSNIAYIR